jgi:hypothetical protein
VSSDPTRGHPLRMFRLQLVTSRVHKGQFIAALLCQIPNKGPYVKIWQPPSTLYSVQLNHIAPVGSGLLFLSSPSGVTLMNEAVKEFHSEKSKSRFYGNSKGPRDTTSDDKRDKHAENSKEVDNGAGIGKDFESEGIADRVKRHRVQIKRYKLEKMPKTEEKGSLSQNISKASNRKGKPNSAGVKRSHPEAASTVSSSINLDTIEEKLRSEWETDIKKEREELLDEFEQKIEAKLQQRAYEAECTFNCGEPFQLSQRNWSSRHPFDHVEPSTHAHHHVIPVCEDCGVVLSGGGYHVCTQSRPPSLRRVSPRPVRPLQMASPPTYQSPFPIPQSYDYSPHYHINQGYSYPPRYSSCDGRCDHTRLCKCAHCLECHP